MGEEGAVEAAGGDVQPAAHEEAGARSPEDVGHAVVLPVVALARAEDAAAAVGIAVAVEVASAGSGVLEGVLVPVRQEFGLAGAAVGIRVHVVQERAVPAVGGGYVGVEEHHVLVAVGEGYGAVVALGEAVVLVE